MKRNYIILSLFLFSIIVTFIDAFVHPTYFLKIPIKIIFFLALPMLFFVLYKDDLPRFKELFKFNKKNLFISFVIGLVVYIVIVGGYAICNNFIDFSNVTNMLNNMGITKDNFIIVSLYLSILNSFLEEFFFRGFGFITLKNYVSNKFAYIYSPILFAIYHVGMMLGMFNIWFFLLLLFGLFIGGIIFNYLADKFGNIYPSWFVHMATNFGINTVGFILFGLL